MKRVIGFALCVLLVIGAMISAGFFSSQSGEESQSLSRVVASWVLAFLRMERNNQKFHPEPRNVLNANAWKHFFGVFSV